MLDDQSFVSKDNAGLLVQFHYHNDQIYTWIRIKGQPKSDVDRKMREQDKIDFPREWAAFEAGQEPPLNGTHISKLPGVNASLVAELNALGVRTIEDMAQLADGHLTKIMGGRTLQNRCKAWLGEDKTTALEDEVATLKKKLEQLEKKKK